MSSNDTWFNLSCCNLQAYPGAGMVRNDDLNGLFESRNGGSARSLFLDYEATKGRSSVPASMDPALSGLSPHFGSRVGSLDQHSIGENIIRSRSAAPSLDGGLSLGPPPGLENSQTPHASNASHDSYLDSDRSHLFHLGQRRPASTGVMGTSQNSSSSVLQSLGSLGLGSVNGGAVRPAAKTLMDLIQEDFPPESPVDVIQHDYPRGGDTYLERPRTTPPMSQQTRGQLYAHPTDAFVNDGKDDLAEPSDRFQTRHWNPYGSRVSFLL
jgi:hypothetical protein